MWIVDVNDGDAGNHLRVSSARMASSAEISPAVSRSSTSARDGEGLLSAYGSCPDQAVETRLDGRVADAEGLLHLLDRTVRAEKRDDKDLVFEAEERPVRGGRN